MAVDDGVLTYHDLLDYITALTDGGARTKDMRLYREAILGAYRDVSMAAEWDYFMTEGRVNLDAAYSTGTIAYDHTGGANERQITLSGGTWPTWAAKGRIRFGDVVYPIDTRVSGSIITLGADFNPGADVAASTAYESSRSVYPLPSDLWRIFDVAVEKTSWITYYITPTEWLQRDRFLDYSGQTWAWTIMRDPDADNRWALWVDPHPSTAEPLGFIYRRRPRTLRWAGTETAARTYTITGSSGATTVTTSVALPSSMVGSVLRLPTGTDHPTGLGGNEPFNEQFKITGLSSTTVTIDSELTAAYSAGTKCVISDPVDMNDTMLEALKAHLEYRLSRMASDTQGTVMAQQLATGELRRALEAESRHMSSQANTISRYNYLFRHLDGAIGTSS